MATRRRGRRCSWPRRAFSATSCSPRRSLTALRAPAAPAPPGGPRPAGGGAAARRASRRRRGAGRRQAGRGPWPSGLLRVARRLRGARVRPRGVAASLASDRAPAGRAGIPRRVGFARRRGAWLFHERVPRDRRRHDVERNLALLEPFGGRAEPPRLHVPVQPEAAAARAAALLPEGRGPLVGIAPGSVWATKRWDAGGLRRRGARPCATTGARVRPARRAGRAGARGRDRAARRRRRDRRSPVGPISRRSSRSIDRLALLVANDSAPMHVACARDVPVVAVFCATTPALGYGPWGPRSAVVEADLACRPCARHGGRRCPRGTEDCMRLVEPDAVLARRAQRSAVAARAPRAARHDRGRSAVLRRRGRRRAADGGSRARSPPSPGRRERAVLDPAATGSPASALPAGVRLGPRCRRDRLGDAPWLLLLAEDEDGAAGAPPRSRRAAVAGAPGGAWRPRIEVRHARRALRAAGARPSAWRRECGAASRSTVRSSSRWRRRRAVGRLAAGSRARARRLGGGDAVDALGADAARRRRCSRSSARARAPRPSSAARSGAAAACCGRAPSAPGRARALGRRRASRATASCSRTRSSGSGGTTQPAPIGSGVTVPRGYVCLARPGAVRAAGPRAILRQRARRAGCSRTPLVLPADARPARGGTRRRWRVALPGGLRAVAASLSPRAGSSRALRARDVRRASSRGRSASWRSPPRRGAAASPRPRSWRRASRAPRLSRRLVTRRVAGRASR